MQLTTQNGTCPCQILQWNYSFELNWFCLDMWVGVEQCWTLCTFASVGTLEQQFMQIVPVITNASFSLSCVLLTHNNFKKKRERIKCHFEGMIKVRSWCVQRQSDAKEVTANSSAWLFVNTVFERFDSDRIYNRLMSQKICKRTRRTGWSKTSWQNSRL